MRTKLAQFVVYAAVFALSCVAATAHSDANGHGGGSIDVDGLSRTYLIYRPPALTRAAAVPLVVMLHGGYGSGKQAERQYNWDATADTGHFVVLFPDGVRRSWNAGTCCGTASSENVDDVGFLTALIAQTILQEHIDPRRIYVTGMSNGALMTYRLACESSIPLAAIGPVAGTFAQPCRTPHRTSVIAIHGLDDTSIPYNGGLGLQTHDVTFPSVQSTIAWWRAHDGCDRAIVTTAAPITMYRSKCPDDRDVELRTITGAGHQWPGSRPLTQAEAFVAARITGRLPAPSSTAMDATAVLWAFFSSHQTDR